MTDPAMLEGRRRRIVVTQHRLLHYRVAFFERLRAACEARRIELRLVHGQASPAESLRGDVGKLEWADEVRNRIVRVCGVDLLWQPFPRHLAEADLIVLMQENRILSNYPWLLRWRARPAQRVCFWGHGRNLQSSSPTGPRERWKARFVNRADWWFAYTDHTRAILAADGFPVERISVLNNAIDDDQFVAELEAVDEAQRSACRRSVGAGHGDGVALYCGSLYSDKRLDLLVAACDLIRRESPGFVLVVVGDGPSRDVIVNASAARPWIHWTGPLRGPEKAAWFRAADLYLCPGAVGLNVLDAFCAGLPMVTTSTARHGPELAYLDSGRNGFVVDECATAFADSAIRLLHDQALRARLRCAALEDARRYTMTEMVRRFVEGVEGCLACPPKTPC